MTLYLIPFLWLSFTLAVYFGARALYRRFARWWTSPLLVAWAVCCVVLIVSHAPYRGYAFGTNWLIAMLGPATVAFAWPIYEQRELIRRNWPILTAGVVSGCLISWVSAGMLAWALDFTPAQLATIIPRSITTPFAVVVSERLGGDQELTTLLVVFTGLFGASIGEILLTYLPIRTVFARGAMFGMGAHGIGTARACEIGYEEGAIAGVVMIFAGLLNVISVSLLMLGR